MDERLSDHLLRHDINVTPSSLLTLGGTCFSWRRRTEQVIDAAGSAHARWRS